MAKKTSEPMRTKLTVREAHTLELVGAGKINVPFERMNEIVTAAQRLPATAIINSVRNLVRLGRIKWDDDTSGYVLVPVATGKED